MERKPKILIVVKYNLSVLGHVPRERFEAKLREAIQEISEVDFTLAFEARTTGFVRTGEQVIVTGEGFSSNECEEFAEVIGNEILPDTFEKLARGEV
jgi:hypothetical protein